MNSTFKKSIITGPLVALGIAAAGLTGLRADNESSGDSTLWNAARPDSHAPIGVMGDHTHNAGEWMLSYRYMYMDMQQNYLGDHEISDSNIVSPTGQGFVVTPTEMSMDMHMSGLMFAPTDNLTLTAMLPYTYKKMSHLTRAGGHFTTSSSGVGDVKFGGLLKIYDANRQRVHLNLIMSAPTGSTSERDGTPMGHVRLPYPMQLGSGTWDLQPGITWLGQTDKFSLGAQVTGYLPLGKNNEGYSLGDAVTGTLWGGLPLADWLSISSRFTLTSWGNIDGSDQNLAAAPGFIPTANPDLRGGTRIDYSAGINYYIRKGAFKGGRLAVEAGLPLYQKLDGPQLGVDWNITAGLQYSF